MADKSAGRTTTKRLETGAAHGATSNRRLVSYCTESPVFLLAAHLFVWRLPEYHSPGQIARLHSIIL